MDSIVSNARPSSLHPSARSGSVLPWWRFISLLTQRESRKELDSLTPQRADDLFEAWMRGETAEVQLVWDRLEKFDSTLFACVRARLAALDEMHWSVAIDADAVEDDPSLQSLAEQQKQLLLSRLSAVENLSAAISALGKADFCGVAALEITGNEQRMRWETINPWHLCRPSIHSPWLYNENADPVPSNPELLDPDAVILREALPMHLPAMFLIVAKRHGVQAWDAFLDKFGIPAAFFETPPGATEQQAAAFDAVVQKIIGEGSGTLPSGAKLHTFETSRDNTQTFEARARWCDDALLQLTLGGKLTMATEAGSGTLAGNAHQESFERLCAASARGISECINRQFCRRILRASFPSSPILAAFSLAPEKEDDRAAQAQIIATLSSAGFRPSAETVSELIGFEVQAFNPPPSASSPALLPVSNSSASDSEPLSPIRNSKLVIRNSEASASEPLTPSEIAALQQLGSSLAAPQLDHDADSIFSSLSAAISSPAEQVEQVEQDEEEPEDHPVENSECRSPNGPQGCSNPEHNLRASQKGSRATKGNPRAKTTQSNTPLKASPSAKPQAKVDAIDHALRATQKGGKVEGVTTIGGKSLTIEAGQPGRKNDNYRGGFGSSHQYAKHGEKTKEKTTPRQAAKTLVLGERSEDKEHGTIAHESSSHVAFTRPLKKDETTLQTAYKKD